MIKILRANASNKDFQSLVNQLDGELAVIDGDDHDFYHQYNGIDDISYAAVALENDIPISCGAIKPFDKESMEIKRMYTIAEARGNGVASKVLSELESWANEMSYTRCILETGKRQHDAVRLYQKNGYSVIQNYGPYVGVENSVCFEKKLPG